jgi:anti-sigma factor RsiW
MPAENRPAELSCAEVLAELSAYLDGELEPTRVEAVRLHVACCERCASFGGRFARAVTELKALGPCPTCPPDVKARLRQRLGLDPTG